MNCTFFQHYLGFKAKYFIQSVFLPCFFAEVGKIPIQTIMLRGTFIITAALEKFKSGLKNDSGSAILKT